MLCSKVAINKQTIEGLPLPTVLKLMAARPLKLTFETRQDWETRKGVVPAKRATTSKPKPSVNEDETFPGTPRPGARPARKKIEKKVVEGPIEYATGLVPVRHCLCLVRGEDTAFALCFHCLRVKTLPSPCAATVFAAKTLPLPCASTVSAAKTLPSPCASTAFAVKTVLLPCGSSGVAARELYQPVHSAVHGVGLD